MYDDVTSKPKGLHNVRLIEEHALKNDFLQNVLDGLSSEQKCLSPVYFYDDIGSGLFYQITKTDDYYPTRTEESIFAEHSKEMSNAFHQDTLLLELGGGGSQKVNALLGHGRIGTYVATDVSKEHLISSCQAISHKFADVDVACFVGDYMVNDFPKSFLTFQNRAVFFPGSTLGNLNSDDCSFLLRKIKAFVGTGKFLVGVDLVKDQSVLEAAYNDKEGITAAFNLNLLDRINKELAGDFDTDKFAHKAFFNGERSRIEMHLESLEDQTVEVAGEKFRFKRGETIHTENSHKFVLDDLVNSFERIGFVLEKVWTDPQKYFAEILFRGTDG